LSCFNLHIHRICYRITCLIFDDGDISFVFYLRFKSYFIYDGALFRVISSNDQNLYVIY
jgi:hypothetical protein